MKKSEAKFDIKDIKTVNISILNGQVNLILRALELYSHNLEYMLNDEGVDAEARQNKIAMLKYTYETILVNQAEQVNGQVGEEDTSNTYANDMLKNNNILEIIPNNKTLKVI